NIRFIPYDEPPRPIGGYAAIQQHVVYPEKARAAGIEDTVIVQAFITEDGKVEKILVLQNKSGDTSLGEAAAAAIKGVTFEPAKQEGTPVGVWIAIPVKFSLEDDAGGASESEGKPPTSEIAYNNAAEYRAALDKLRGELDGAFKVRTDEGVIEIPDERLPAPPPPPEEGAIVRFIPYDEAPMPIGGYAAIMEQVVYPEQARMAGIEGTVMVRAFITEDGKASEITVYKNDTGDPSLGDAAMAAIQNTAFEPA
ncbi:unnamed protein product, partial [marine sediment metagenome]